MLNDKISIWKENIIAKMSFEQYVVQKSSSNANQFQPFKPAISLAN